MPCANCTCGATASQAGCGSSKGAASVALPKRASDAQRSSVWSTTTAVDEQTPLVKKSNSDDEEEEVPAACEAHHGARGVCCRDLNKTEERHLINPDHVRDCIIGLSDGLTVPFALTAGLSGIGSSRIVVLAGIAELVSGSLSMALGGALSAHAELQHYRYQKRATFERVRRSCAGELEREVCEILAPFGVPQDIAAQLAVRLHAVEAQEIPAPPQGELPPPAAQAIRADGLVGPSRGLTPFLVKLGEGLEEVEVDRVWKSALIIGLSYFIGGFIPLLPYMLVEKVQEALFWSIGITGFVLLGFGVAKQKCTGGASDFRNLVWAAVSMLAVGGLAAGASFAIVRALEGSS